MPQAAGLLISQIGLICQLVTAVLLALLFALLSRNRRGRAYFHYWFGSWVALSVALTALVPRFVIAGMPAFAGSEYALSAHLLAALYQVGKIIGLMLLLFGCLNLFNGFRARRWWLATAVFALLFAALVFAATRTLVGVMIWQSLANAVVYAGCAVVLFMVPALRTTGAIRITAMVLVVLSLFWACCFVTPLLPARFIGEALVEVFWRVALYNGFVDLFLQMLLAFGMVLILSEQARGEIQRMHAALASAHHDLKEESARDSLTRALNRRALAEGTGLEAALADCGTAMVFDLDNLKQVNDRHGHRAGDALLKYFVEAMGGQLRAADRLYRYGGDEFLLVMPRAECDEALQRFQRFFQQVPHLQLPDTDASVALAASFGAARYSREVSLDAAIIEADRRMYADKRQRKARTEPPTAV